MSKQTQTILEVFKQCSKNGLVLEYVYKKEDEKIWIWWRSLSINEMDKLWTDFNWDNNTMDNWSNEHLRTSYKD